MQDLRTFSESVSRLSLNEMRYLFTFDDLKKGASLARGNTPMSLNIRGNNLTAEFADSHETIKTVIRNLHPFNADCTCNTFLNCHHMAAVLIFLGAPVTENSWRTLLTNLRQDFATHSNPEGKLKPLGLLVSRGQYGELTGKLLPVTTKNNGKWARSKLSWPSIMPSTWKSATDQYLPLHLNALRQLRSVATDHYPWAGGETTLSQLESFAFSELQRCVRAGIQLFVGDSQTPLVLSDKPWDVQARITSTSESDNFLLRFVPLTPEGRAAEVIPGAKPPLAIGYMNGVATLAEISSSVPPSILEKLGVNTVEIPHSELAEFESSILGILPDSIDINSPDGSYAPGIFSAPHLHLHISRHRNDSSTPGRSSRRLNTTDFYDDDIPGLGARYFSPPTPLMGEKFDLEWQIHRTLESPHTGTRTVVTPFLDPSQLEEGSAPTVSTKTTTPTSTTQPTNQPEPSANSHSDPLALATKLWEKASLYGQPNFTGIHTITFDIYTTVRERLLPSFDNTPITYSFDTDADIVVVEKPSSVTTRATKRKDWLELDVVIDVEGTEIPLPIVYEALATGRDYVDYSGLILHLGEDFNSLRRLLLDAAALGEVKPDSIRIPSARMHALDFAHIEAGRELREKLQHMQDLANPVPVPNTVNAQLRPYQVEGFSWLTHLARAGMGGLLADDMGLGKTLQLLTMIEEVRSAPANSAPSNTRRKTRQRKGHTSTNATTQPPVLVVAPTSVVSTWAQQAEQFTPHLRVETVTAGRKKRGKSLESITHQADVIVTSYAIARMDREEYRSLEWGGLIADEAQAIKNPSTVGYKALQMLERPWTFAVTGTPVENSLNDLAALLALCTPGLLPSRASFAQNFRKPIEEYGDENTAEILQRLIRPFVMRRRKAEVATDLPPRIVTDISVDMTPDHAQMYRRRLERERQEVLGLVDNISENRVSILASLTRLRRTAIDPGLYEEKTRVKSAKTEFLIEHLRVLLPEGHRVLVFSQFPTYLKRIAKRLREEHISFSYLDGATRNRDDAIADFKAEDGYSPVFLISLKAGGTGLTLTEADYVFIMDAWWNPAVEEQAIDRAHRIGQDKPVNVYRLASKGTIEEKVVALQEHKRNLAELIDAGASGPISAEDVRELLNLPPLY